MAEAGTKIGIEIGGLNNYLDQDEVLIVKGEGGKAKVSVFGASIPSSSSLSGKDVSGGVYLWGEDGKSREGKALSGQTIPAGGRSIRPGETVEIELAAGSKVEIGIAGTADSEYQMFNDFDPAKKGDVLKIKGS